MTVDLLAAPLDAGGQDDRLRAIHIDLRRAGPPDVELLAAWIRDPQRFDPRTTMPNLGVTEAHARDMAAYLQEAK